MKPDILTPFLDDADVILYAGDCVEVMKRMPESSVDAIVTDPPYGLEFMGKGWDGFGTPLGFQTWTEAWAVEAFRILKPGGHLLAFAGTRTYHRMASGVEDAGFEIRDCIAWMYGSGFPKSLDVSKAIDKTDASDEQQARRYRFTEWVRSTGLSAKQIDNATGTLMGNHYTTHPTQPAIMTREHLEAIRHLVAEIPEWVEAECDKRSVESKNMANRQVLWERVVPLGPGFASEKYQGDNTGRKDYCDTLPHTLEATKWNGWGTALKPAFEPVVVARRPLIGTVAANVLEHGTGALNIDACRISTDDYFGGGSRGSSGFAGGYESGDGQQPGSPLGRWPANIALDATAAAMLDEQSGDRPGATSNSTGSTAAFTTPTSQGTLLGYGDTGGASRFFYTAKASRQDRNVGGLANNTHPTVKPTDLMRWLIRLVTPPGGIILDPFGGSGSTGLAARAENVRCILIEREPEYLQIIRDRLAQQNLFATETTTNAT
jgi:site-specific DNA-methyltransferase (adenine-specific)